MADNVVKVLTPEARLMFPHFFEPYSGIEGAEEKYSAVLLFEAGADLTGLKEAVQKAAAGLKSKAGARNPICSGDERAEEWGEVFKGAKYIRVSSRFQPAIVDTDRSDILDKSKLYSGCYVRAVIRAYPYDKAGNRGVAFGVEAVQFLRDGEALGGSRASVALFDDGKAPSAAPVSDDPFAE